MEDLEKALSKTKIQLMSRPDSTFFTTVCFSLRFYWDPKIRTACTNGKEIRMNPDFFLNLSPDERVFLMLHETLHVAYLHMMRLMNREPGKWNVAADHVINLQLLDRGFKMPASGLADRTYAGMSTEEVYDRLPTIPPQEFDMDIVMSDEPPLEVEQHIQDILIRAATQSKLAGDKPGSIPGDIEIFLYKLLNPKLPWQRILQKYMQGMAKSDYSFRKPNRRHFPRYILPGMFNESLMNIAIAVDTSGSVSNTEFTHFISEVNCILRMMKPEKLTLLQFDTTVKSVNQIKTVHELSQVQFVGRGGTKIDPVMEWAAENKPQLLLVFSDGEFHFTCGAPQKTQVVWIIHDNECFNAPFGKTIHYTMEK